MSFKTFEYDVLILEKHLDSLGHVNNAIYLELLEEARWDFITKNGYGLKELKLNQKGPVILEINLRFKKELFNREKIKILTVTKEISNPKVMKLSQNIYRDSDLILEADFTVGFMDLKLRKLIVMPEDWLKAIGE